MTATMTATTATTESRKMAAIHRISSKSAKSREIHKNMQNPAKFAGNLTKHLSAQCLKVFFAVGAAYLL